MSSAKATTASQKISPRNNGISVRMSVNTDGRFSGSGSISYNSALTIYSFFMLLSIPVSEAYGSS